MNYHSLGFLLKHLEIDLFIKKIMEYNIANFLQNSPATARWLGMLQKVLRDICLTFVCLVPVITLLRYNAVSTLTLPLQTEAD